MEDCVSADCFVHRVAGLPLVSAAVQQALLVYQRTKNYNELMNASLNLVEQGVVLAATKAQPIYKKVESPLVVASKLACVGLDRVEEACPAVKMTPDEAWKTGYKYYEGSSIKKSVDSALATKEYGKSKAVALRSSVRGAVRASLDVFGSSLDYADALVDRYVAEETGDNTDHDYATTLSLERFSIIGGKVVHGLSVKGSRRIRATRKLLAQRMQNLAQTLTAVEQLLGERMKSNAVSQNVANLIATVQEQANRYKIEPTVVLLRWMQMSASTTAATSGFLVKQTSAYLPEAWNKPIQASADYLADFDSTCAQAKTLTELRTEVVAEAKERLATAEKLLASGVDWAADQPALSWLNQLKRSAPGKPDETEETRQD